MRPGFDPRSSHCSNYINSLCISPILLHLQPLHDLIIGPDSGHCMSTPGIRLFLHIRFFKNYSNVLSNCC